MKRSFAQRGAFVEVSTTVEKEKLDSKQVLATLRNFDSEIAKIHDQFGKLEQQKLELAKGLKHNEDLRKQIGKHEEWAKGVQASKVKALVESVKVECEQTVRDTYVPDSALTAEQNTKQMFAQYQQKIATHKSVADEIDSDFVREHIFVNSILSNPFE